MTKLHSTFLAPMTTSIFLITIPITMICHKLTSLMICQRTQLLKAILRRTLFKLPETISVDFNNVTATMRCKQLFETGESEWNQCWR